MKYGYRLMKKNLETKEYEDYHAGAYGFNDEETAIQDAKRRLKAEIYEESFTMFSIQCYAFNSDDGNSKEEKKPFPFKLLINEDNNK